MLSALGLVPLLGTVVFSGYMLVAMRDAAWGIDQGLPPFSRGNEILRRGWDGFVVGLVWSLPLAGAIMIAAIVYGLVAVPHPSSSAPLWWVGLALAPGTALTEVFLHVAWLRAAVYLKASAGLSLKAVRMLIGQNWRGFRRVAWLPIAAAVLGAVLSLPATLFITKAGLSSLVTNSVRLVSGLVVGFVTAPVSLTVAIAYGIWGSETEPHTWPPLRVDSSIRLAETVGQGAVGNDPL